MKLLIILGLLMEMAVSTVSAAVRETALPKSIVTAYCCCPVCCGKWAYGENLRRDLLVSGVSVAGPRRYPLGSHVWIEGLGERIIQDRPARRYDNRFDIFFTNHVQAVAFGERKAKVVLLQMPVHKAPSARTGSLPVRATPRQKIRDDLASAPDDSRPKRS